MTTTHDLRHLCLWLAGLAAAGTACDGPPSPSDEEPAERRSQSLINGTDDRREAYQMAPSRRALADSIPLVTSAGELVDQGDGTSVLRTTPHWDQGPGNPPLCRNGSEARFIDQPSARGQCTGMLIGPKYVATASHCVGTDVTQTRIVFGFEAFDGTSVRTRFENVEIFRAVNVLSRSPTSDHDFVVLELDRAVTKRRVLRLWNGPLPASGRGIFTIGHSALLPLKHSDGRLTHVGPNEYFYYQDADVFGGNSGGPTFDAWTYEVIGMSHRGQPDWVLNGSCWTARVCDSGDCVTDKPIRWMRATLGGNVLGTSGTYLVDLSADGRADLLAEDAFQVRVHRSWGSGFHGAQSWTNGYEPGQRGSYFTDVTGDGYADAILVYDHGVYVREGSWSGFGGLYRWGWVHVPSARSIHFADVTGDRRADMIVVRSGNTEVHRSLGWSFERPQTWAWGLLAGTRDTDFADVTGDGYADAITTNDDGIYVRRSSGWSFGGVETWATGSFYGPDGLDFADVNGDGRMDAVRVEAWGIDVRLSFGRDFAGAQRWSWSGAGSRGTLLGDIDGDRRADLVVLQESSVQIRRSSGLGFGTTETWLPHAFYGAIGRAQASR